MPMALGSAWGVVAAVPMALLLVARTALEDRTLHVELAGYPEYARRTRFRLIPGLW
jgi:protein-S-isoprenylcysteine O-methyltransferase Ste14